MRRVRRGTEVSRGIVASSQKNTQFQGLAAGILMDTKSCTAYGGSGQTFDWGLALKAKELDLPLILSGGIDPSNINKAIQLVNPFAIDLCSGVESSLGKKDYNNSKFLEYLAIYLCCRMCHLKNLMELL